MDKKRYIAYYRVSTHKQGVSGLGLEAQRSSVINTVGQDAVIREYIEIESGKRSNRPELEKAIEDCKKSGCILVVAKLDRLGRRTKHLFEIKENLELLACDLPNMDTLLFGIYATIAQSEGEVISARTKDALAAKKAQGYTLGNPNNLDDRARAKSIQVRRAKAGQKWRYSKERMVAMEAQREGLSLRKIAARLNTDGYRTSRGKQFQATTVKRLLS
jgi:DNA invertase Pin-like site-specific DNA recombinase